MDRLVIENAGESCDRLAQLFLDQMFDDALLINSVSHWGSSHHYFGWGIAFGWRWRILKIYSLKLHGIRALLDIGVDRSNVFAHHSHEEQLK